MEAALARTAELEHALDAAQAGERARKHDVLEAQEAVRARTDELHAARERAAWSSSVRARTAS